MPDTTTIYITRDIEEHGVVIAEMLAAHWASGSGDKTVARTKSGLIFFLQNGEFFATAAEAIADAEARRTKRIASLKKQIAAMEAIDLTKVREG